MSNVKVPNLLSFLILVSLFRTVRTDCDNITKETLQSDFGEIVDVNTTAFSIDSLGDDKIEDCEPNEPYKRNLKLYGNLGNDSYPNEVTEIMPERKPRSLTNFNGTVTYGVECLSCFANSSTTGWNCYAGSNVPSVKCADIEHCFIEINPLFIRRGCILPGRINRTFVCKCPLCNDKPSFDIRHYEYIHRNDWEYDNARLQTPIKGIDLMCKVCETKGTNPTSDKNCRSGKNADYMVCPRNHLCYTNIDDETDFVSRGCIERPLFNSMYFFCNITVCNMGEFPNPVQRLRLRADAIQLKNDRGKKKHRTALKSFGAKSCTIDFSSMLILMLTITQCI